jgi:glycosyltransferase involved in cell wall biosynthesis
MNNSFSLIVPVYNEEKIIVKNTELLVRFLDRLRTPYEIFIGSNGSTDRTNELALALAKKHSQIKLITFKKKGVGRVFKKAVKDAKFEKILSLDIDLPTSSDFLIHALKLLDNNDLVVGTKKDTQKRSFHRKLFSDGFAFLVKLLLGISYTDYAPNAKAYRRSAILEHIDRLDNGTIYVLELLHYTHRDGKKIVEIPVRCSDKRKSKFSVFKEIKHKFKGLISIWVKHRILAR